MRPPKSSASTSSSSRRLIEGKPEDGYAVRAILPRPEERGLPRIGSIRTARLRMVNLLKARAAKVLQLDRLDEAGIEGEFFYVNARSTSLGVRRVE